MDKHTDSVTYIDFKPKEMLCASSGDDGQVFVFNYQSYRQEGCLKIDPEPPIEIPAPVKICKFLYDTDVLVSADLDGYLNFWCVTAGLHPKKN